MFVINQSGTLFPDADPNTVTWADPPLDVVAVQRNVQRSFSPRLAPAPRSYSPPRFSRCSSRTRQSTAWAPFGVAAYVFALMKLCEGESERREQIATYTIQNLNTLLSVLVFQTRGKSPALPIGQNLSQGPNGFGFVGCAGDVLPQPLVTGNPWGGEPAVGCIWLHLGRERIDQTPR